MKSSASADGKEHAAMRNLLKPVEEPLLKLLFLHRAQEAAQVEKEPALANILGCLNAAAGSLRDLVANAPAAPMTPASTSKTLAQTSISEKKQPNATVDQPCEARDSLASSQVVSLSKKSISSPTISTASKSSGPNEINTSVRPEDIPCSSIFIKNSGECRWRAKEIASVFVPYLDCSYDKRRMVVSRFSDNACFVDLASRRAVARVITLSRTKNGIRMGKARLNIEASKKRVNSSGFQVVPIDASFFDEGSSPEADAKANTKQAKTAEGKSTCVAEEDFKREGQSLTGKKEEKYTVEDTQGSESNEKGTDDREGIEDALVRTSDCIRMTRKERSSAKRGWNTDVADETTSGIIDVSRPKNSGPCYMCYTLGVERCIFKHREKDEPWFIHQDMPADAELRPTHRLAMLRYGGGGPERPENPWPPLRSRRLEDSERIKREAAKLRRMIEAQRRQARISSTPSMRARADDSEPTSSDSTEGRKSTNDDGLDSSLLKEHAFSAKEQKRPSRQVTDEQVNHTSSRKRKAEDSINANPHRGDWLCPKCGNDNFGRRNFCHRSGCKTEKTHPDVVFADFTEDGEIAFKFESSGSQRIRPHRETRNASTSRLHDGRLPNSLDDRHRRSQLSHRQQQYDKDRGLLSSHRHEETRDSLRGSKIGEFQGRDSLLLYRDDDEREPKMRRYNAPIRMGHAGYDDESQLSEEIVMSCSDNLTTYSEIERDQVARLRKNSFRIDDADPLHRTYPNSPSSSLRCEPNRLLTPRTTKLSARPPPWRLCDDDTDGNDSNTR